MKRERSASEANWIAMSTMKLNEQAQPKTARIAPSVVLDAFKATGRKPEQYVHVGDDCQCGLSAVWESKGGDPFSERYWDSMGAAMELSRNYIDGFMTGWDGIAKYQELTELSSAFDKGWDDGSAAWKECRHLAWPDTCLTPPTIDGE